MPPFHPLLCHRPNFASTTASSLDSFRPQLRGTIAHHSGTLPSPLHHPRAATTRARCRRCAPAPPLGDAPPPATNPHPNTILRFASPSSTPRHQPRRRNRLVVGEPPPNRPVSPGVDLVRRHLSRHHPPPPHCRVGLERHCRLTPSPSPSATWGGPVGHATRIPWE
jgi:hypothetical protein